MCCSFCLNLLERDILKHQNNTISVLYQMYSVLLIKALMISSNQARDASHNRVQIIFMLCCLRNTDVCVLRRLYFCMCALYLIM